jgi:hypothetical protein
MRGHTAQRIALLAAGQAWILLGSRKKIEDRKMLENRTESPPSTVRFVRHIFPERACTKNLNVNLKQSLEYIDLGSDANSILNYLSGSLLAGI